MVVRLTREQIERMTAQAQAEAPNECCGLLLGRGDVVQEVFPGRNKDESPYTYEMHPQDALRAFQAMDDRGLELVGTYHSHTHTEAFPSKTDRAKALPFYPDARYVIISLSNPARPQVRAFRLLDGKDEAGSPTKVVVEEDVIVT